MDSVNHHQHTVLMIDHKISNSHVVVNKDIYLFHFPFIHFRKIFFLNLKKKNLIIYFSIIYFWENRVVVSYRFHFILSTYMHLLSLNTWVYKLLLLTRKFSKLRENHVYRFNRFSIIKFCDCNLMEYGTCIL